MFCERRKCASDKKMTHYHKYKIVGQNEKAVVEICEECKHKLITRKNKDGRIDNKTYLKEHARDFAQKIGPTANIFRQYYGEGER